MSETTESQPPSEQPTEPAPRPGVHLRAPGAAPRRPAEESDQHDLTSPATTASPPDEAPAAVTGEAKTAAKKSRPRKGAGGGSSSGRERRSAGPTMTETETSTGAPTDGADRAPTFVEPAQLTLDLAHMVMAASEEANERWAPTGTPLFVASDDEALGVSGPAARIVVRHMPAGMGGAGNPDLADAVSAVITLFRYGVRQLRMYHAIRRARAAAPVDEAEQQQPADPLSTPGAA